MYRNFAVCENHFAANRNIIEGVHTFSNWQIFESCVNRSLNIRVLSLEYQFGVYLFSNLKSAN
jgi:hypothetical protein